MSTTGRPSKVKLLGYHDEIINLRNQGLSYEKIASELNTRYPNNISISKDVVHRHLKGLTKKTLTDKPVAMEELISDVFQELYFKLKTSSMESRERVAFTSYLKAKENKLKSKAYQFYSGKSRKGVYSEFEKVRRLILDFSTRLCLNCRHRVLEEVKELEKA